MKQYDYFLVFMKWYGRKISSVSNIVQTRINGELETEFGIP